MPTAVIDVIRTQLFVLVKCHPPATASSVVVILLRHDGQHPLCHRLPNKPVRFCVMPEVIALPMIRGVLCIAPEPTRLHCDDCAITAHTHQQVSQWREGEKGGRKGAKRAVAVAVIRVAPCPPSSGWRVAFAALNCDRTISRRRHPRSFAQLHLIEGVSEKHPGGLTVVSSP